MIILNFKTYESGTGQNAVTMAKICEEVAKESGVKIIPAVQALNIEKVAAVVKIQVFAQHVDAIEYGANTGKILPVEIKAAGAKGSLLNHSENTIMAKEILTGIDILKKLDMTSIVCTKSPSESAMVAKFGPDYIAVEPPELIGSGRSVTKAKPQVITKTIEQVLKIDKIPVLCGAGIVNGEDVKKALELGAEGILIASAVMKADNPKDVLMDLCTGFD